LELEEERIDWSEKRRLIDWKINWRWRIGVERED
jgi:hypothetical protein